MHSLDEQAAIQPLSGASHENRPRLHFQIELAAPQGFTQSVWLDATPRVSAANCQGDRARGCRGCSDSLFLLARPISFRSIRSSPIIAKYSEKLILHPVANRNASGIYLVSCECKIHRIDSTPQSSESSADDLSIALNRCRESRVGKSIEVCNHCASQAER